MSATLTTLILMAGLPGAGKSTLALALGQALGWPVIDKDILESVARTAGVETVRPTTLAYDLAFALVTDLLCEQRLPVILDCPAITSAPVVRASQIAERAGARFQVVLCLAGQQVRNERMAHEVAPASRAWRAPARRRPSEIATDGREHFTHLPSGTLLVDSTRPAAETVREIVLALRH